MGFVDNPPPATKRARRGTMAKKKQANKNNTSKNNSKSKIKAVMFIPYTKH